MSNPAIKVMMMPKDTNVHNTIFGGVILSYIDQAGGVIAQEAATEYIKKLTEKSSKNNSSYWDTLRHIRFVTIGMDKIEFHEPVFVGDVVSFDGEVLKTGNSSITIKITVMAQRFQNITNIVKVTEATVTFVAVDSNRKKFPIFSLGK